MALRRASFGDIAETRAVREAEGQVARAAFLLLLFFGRQRKVNKNQTLKTKSA